MPEHLRAMVVVLAVSAVAFAAMRAPASALIAPADFARRRNLWLALTLIAFLAHNFWVYAIVAAALVAAAARRDASPVGLFFFLALVVPATGLKIPGLGLINFIFELTHVRMLALTILLPAYLGLIGRRDVAGFGRTGPDRLLMLFMALVAIQVLREAPFTSVLRQCFYLFIDVFLPYFVISRSLRSVADFREAMAGFVLAAALLAPVLAFEALWGWHLYRGVAAELGVPLDLLSYTRREGLLRAMGPTGHPIVAGMFLCIALGFYAYLGRALPAGWRRLGWAALAGGIAAPLSRGPWVGAVALLGVFVATGRNALGRLLALGAAGAALLAALWFLPGGRRIVDLLPFIGQTDAGSIDYRAQLLDAAYAVVARDFWFGSINFGLAPELQAMLQGQGIIDIVNTYLLVVLEYGMVGLALFAGFFVLVGWNTLRALLACEPQSEARLLGRVLLGTLAAVLVVIFTVSPVFLVPLLYWSTAGLCAGYVHMLSSQRAAGRPPAAAAPARKG